MWRLPETRLGRDYSVQRTATTPSSEARSSTSRSSAARAEIELDAQAAPVAHVLELHPADADPALVDHPERLGDVLGGEVDLELAARPAEAPQGRRLQPAERAQADEHDAGGDQRRGEVAGARRHPDGRDDPEAGRGRQPAHRQPLPDDRARAEEADARHDLGAIRVGSNTTPEAVEKPKSVQP